jgi:hypothetical protein
LVLLFEFVVPTLVPEEVLDPTSMFTLPTFEIDPKFITLLTMFRVVFVVVVVVVVTPTP